MYAQSPNWLAVLAIFLVFGLLVWRTMRVKTTTRERLVLRSLALWLLLFFGGVLLWNTLVSVAYP
jgi:hypothetical protein